MITLRVADPTQSIRFYRDVLGFPANLLSADLAHITLPGLLLALVKDTKLDLVHGPGASRHRPGVGVEIHVPVSDASEIAGEIGARGGFLAVEEPGRVTARDADGYALTFETGV